MMREDGRRLGKLAWEVPGKRVSPLPWEEVKRLRTMKVMSWAVRVSLVAFRKNNAFNRSC